MSYNKIYIFLRLIKVEDDFIDAGKHIWLIELILYFG